MVDVTDTASRITLARNRLTAKLREFQRRGTHARAVLAPMRHLASPWLYVGVAAFVGYRLGRPAPVCATIAAPPCGTDTLLHAVVRASLVAIAQAVVRRVVVDLDGASGGAPSALRDSPTA
jgi:hypothetical protein